MAGSSVGSLPVGGSRGSSVSPVTGSATFQALTLVAQVQANALVDPADSPAKDQLRMVYDAAGNTALYFWRKAASTWTAVQLA